MYAEMKSYAEVGFREVRVMNDESEMDVAG